MKILSEPFDLESEIRGKGVVVACWYKSRSLSDLGFCRGITTPHVQSLAVVSVEKSVSRRDPAKLSSAITHS